MFIAKSSSYSMFMCFGDDPQWRQLLSESLCAFADGRLPGNLGDSPEVLDTGEGVG